MTKLNDDKFIVISAINFFEGGPLSVLNDCINSIKSKRYNEFTFLILVHKISLFELYLNIPNVKFIEFPISRKSYLFRIFYEYIYFYNFSKKYNIHLWFSFHDITPNVRANRQVVYCHNPIPFLRMRFLGYFLQPTLLFFKLFYRFVYKINLQKNIYIIVQQQWLKNLFSRDFKFNKDKIIISLPKSNFLINKNASFFNSNSKKNELIFFYPTFARSFKNIEIICEAASILEKMNIRKFKVYITISKNDNFYSRYIYNKYSHLSTIFFIGKLTREKVFNYYGFIDILLFPSLIETWGLPLSEFQLFNKPIVASNFLYARENLNLYSKVKFFDPYDSFELSNIMLKFILSDLIEFDKNQNICYDNPLFNNWEDLLDKIIYD
uniref:glycosyltransferase n=1 Tax=Algoriphagus sp. TaxID=1872435 RepID=UPI004047FAEB